MNWRQRFIIAGLLLTTGMGCVEFWSKEGIVQEAVAKDTKENLPQPTCSNGKTPQLVCLEGKSDQCHLECPK
jgi:hypothetical protein